IVRENGDFAQLITPAQLTDRRFLDAATDGDADNQQKGAGNDATEGEKSTDLVSPQGGQRQSQEIGLSHAPRRSGTAENAIVSIPKTRQDAFYSQESSTSPSRSRTMRSPKRRARSPSCVTSTTVACCRR